MQSKTPWLLGALVVLACTVTALASRSAVRAQERALAEQERALADLDARLAVLTEAPPSDPEVDAGELTHRLATLDQRLARLERSPRREVAPSTVGEGVQEPGSEASDAPGESASPDRSPRELRDEFDALLERVLGPDLDFAGSEEDQERFWELVKDSSVVDDRMADLERRVELAPNDVGLRMALADTYIAKLFSVPGGPESGRWGGKAEKQWRAVLDLDPEHWEAQFTLANNLAYYPDVMGKTGEAIRGLERARELQERAQPLPEHQQTYLSLSRLYLRSNDSERAREALAAGLSYHPDSEALAAALSELEQR